MTTATLAEILAKCSLIPCVPLPFNIEQLGRISEAAALVTAAEAEAATSAWRGSVEFLTQTLAHECMEAGQKSDWRQTRRIALMRVFIEDVVVNRTTHGWLDPDEANALGLERDAWRACAEQLGNAHYILDGDLRAAKHREALAEFSRLVAASEAVNGVNTQEKPCLAPWETEN